jgi:signal transduction histidine kinase
MASGIVHDGNNALVPIVAYAEVLQEHSDAKVRQMAEQMQSALDDLTHIINRLRAFYRPRDPQEELEPVDLNEAVRQVADLTKPRWYDIPQREGITIDLRMALDETLPPIAGVGAEIREALTNLIFNAVDAIVAKGTPHGIIILRTGRRDEWAFVEVTDTGIGMDEATKRRVFEPFFTTKGEKGSGLGLAMVYGTMERHDGSVEIESALGVGTTVRLLFPFAGRDRESACGCLGADIASFAPFDRGR